jgi:hypothetical protein
MEKEAIIANAKIGIRLAKIKKKILDFLLGSKERFIQY